ncbi:MAG TPA: hypothetical protein VL977_00575, partial [Solirubrobacteraceae bacterium]|nr:hypothetical protein [Solirubrobacteraceae bacterium]
ALVQQLAGERELGALTIPLGLAAVIVVAGMLTAFSATASLAAPATAAGGAAGLILAVRRAKLGVAPALAAVGVLLVYGAPVILSGEATFLGYVRLDDTATWFNLTDWLFSHGRTYASNFPGPISSYQLLAETNLGTGIVPGGLSESAYPSGAFMVLGVGHFITQIDIAWIFQPYLACCAAAVALCAYAMLEPLLEWRWLRAFVAFIAAQSAVLFGYAAWGGVKELTGAFLFALAVALLARAIARDEPGWRDPLPLAVVGGALMLTLGPDGSAVYGLPILGCVYLLLLWRVLGRARSPAFFAITAVSLLVAALVALLGLGVGLRYAGSAGLVLVAALVFLAAGARGLLRLMLGFGLVVAATALAGFPMWLLLGHYLSADQGSFNAGNAQSTTLGNLVAPLRALQMAGIWPVGDFRDVASAGAYAAPSALPRYGFAYLTFAAGAGAAAFGLWRRRPEVWLYALLAVLAVLAPWLRDATPWLLGKGIAISSPAVLLAGLTGGALLFKQERTPALAAGAAVLVALSAGVLWSNWLQYRNVTLAPRDQLSELQTIGAKVAGKGPTFVNEYEIYADRHFLRAGAPTEPAEYRYGSTESLPTVTGAVLTKSAFADLDSFSLATLRPYRSLVVRNSPVESRPPSIYDFVWSGTYYSLWQQPARPTHRVIEHVPLGDTNLDYCGASEGAGGTLTEPLCSIQPAAVAPCPRIRSLARVAAADG